MRFKGGREGRGRGVTPPPPGETPEAFPGRPPLPSYNSKISIIVITKIIAIVIIITLQIIIIMILFIIVSVITITI